MREMKDSGMEWLGEIPSYWAVTRIKNLFELRNERNFEALEDVNLISLYTDKGVVQHDDLEKTTGNKAVTADGYKIVKKDDIVVNIILCWMGAIGRSDYDGVTSPAYDIYKPNEGTNSRYYHYLFRTPQFSGECYRYGRGIMLMRWRTYSTEFKSISIPQPPVDEQERIVGCLNTKMIQVDTLIDNVQAQIEKLKAYKQSVITEVVTKGLDPTVPMKDSGVEWIGSIPIHWTTNKIIRCFGVIGSGTTPKSADDSFFEGDINWIQSGDINGGILSETRFQITKDTVEKTSALKVYSTPFIVIAMYGASIGNLSISQIDACTNQACCVLSAPVNGLLLEYLFYAFTTAKDYLIWRADGGGQPNISQDKVKSLWVPIPPTEDQKAIVQHLNKKRGQIDRLIALKQSKIEKLEQYKKSLIYEYVTGKKEVS